MSGPRILIVNLTRFGDLLQTSPTVATLRARHPDATITFLAERNFADVCEGIPGIDHLLRAELDRLGNLVLDGGAGLLEAYRYVEALVHELRGERFDLALNLSSSRMTAVFMGLLGIPDVRGWSMTADGFRIIRHPWARLFATMCLHRRFASFNLVDYYRAMAGGGGATCRLHYDVGAPAAAEAARLLAEAGVRAEDQVVALQLGASREIRQWPAAAFGAVARRLARPGRRIVLVGGARDRSLAAAVQADAGAEVVDACGRTGVAELGALLARADLLVSGDTGPMHMAAAVETPIVGLFFGPALPFDTGPYGPDHVLVHTGAPCAPCDHNVTCLEPFCRDEIEPALVAAAVEHRLAADWAALEGLAATSTRVRLYRTGFDHVGLFESVPLDDRPAGRDDVLRAAYRAMWLAVLDGVPLTATVGGRVDVEPFRAVARLAEHGRTLAAELERESRAPDGSVREMERLGAALETQDRGVAELGLAHPDAVVLTRMFTFGKENLEGDDVPTLAAETRALYEALGLEAQVMATLLSDHGREESPHHARLHQ